MPLSLRLVLCAICVTASSTLAVAAPPAADLLPATTKGFVSLPDFDELSARFDETQLGELAQHDDMKPFADDLLQQFKDRLSDGGVKLGIKIDDLKDVYGGEIAFALLQPEADPIDEKTGKPLDNLSHAMMLIVDITGKRKEANKLLTKIDKNQVEQGATKSTIKVEGVDGVKYVFPKKKGEVEARVAYYLINKDQLLAGDNLDVITELVKAQAAGKAAEPLSGFTPYIEVQTRVDKAAAGLAPNIRWFIEPFGLVEVLRAQAGGRKKRGKDLLKLLQEEGFEAIQGGGGIVNFNAGPNKEFDILHRSFAYAPTDENAEAGARFVRGARVMDFPNGAAIAPPAWIPQDLATYLAFRFDMQDAFKYVKTIVNAYADDEIFDEVMLSLKEDNLGPQVDIPQDIIPYLGEEVILISDCVQPVTTESERRLLAIEITDVAQVKAAVWKILKNEPNAEPLKLKDADGNELEAWKLEEIEEELPTLTIVGPTMPTALVMANAQEEEAAKMPNMAITIHDKWLLVSSHVGLLEKTLQTKADLAAASDYVRVQTALTSLGMNQVSFQQFGRTDESFRVTHEMLRTNQMPQSKSLLGVVINRIWAIGHEDEKHRMQELDASKLPAFEKMAPYLGPAGLFVTTENDGWMETGVTLRK
ncbi:hypothetical protein [Blastopirellula retiformator]|nr:hypothetical protein [Blastopirellula retiformator]